MRKKFFLVFCALVMLITGTAYASEVPDYLNGDTNFILTGARQGTGYYLDKSSLVITSEDAQTRELAVNVLVVAVPYNGFDLELADNPKIQSELTLYYKYDLDSHRMYKKSSADEDWRIFNPNGTTAETGSDFSGELAYYIAYKEKFSDGQQFPDEFYARADQ